MLLAKIKNTEIGARKVKLLLKRAFARSLLVTLLALIISTQFPFGAAHADPKAEEAKCIGDLISAINNSPYTFIRNGDEHTGIQAAEHIEKKYEHFKDKIKTAEDFIDSCAASSMLSGKPYLIRLSPDETRPLKDWLHEKLGTMRKEKR